MSNYTADEVERMADWVYSHGRSTGNAVPMMREFERRLRQEEEDAKRNPVMEPRPGDYVQYQDGTVLVYCEESEDNPGGTTDREFWRSQAKHGASTIIRRREPQQ